MKLLSVRSSLAGLGAALVLVVAACGGGGGDSGAGTGTGTLRLALTDAPACGYDAVNVTVQKVRVHKSGSASDTDSGWSEIVLSPARRVDLLGLTNGALTELGQTPLPAGTYTQMRLVLAPNDASAPLANSVVPTGGSETALTTPSAQQSGLKMNINIEVAPNQLADFVLDFDACKSVVRRGNSGQFNLKPVVSVIPRLISAVQGFVDPALLPLGAIVSVQQSGVVLRATPPDATGRFLLQPVAPGNYDLVLTATGRTTLVVTGVPVAPQIVTTLNTSGSALLAPVSTTRAVSGSVTKTATAVDAVVRASQVFLGGPTVEVASAVSDALTGGYSFLLPLAAPQKAIYVASPAPLAFVPDASAAGKYTMGATLDTASLSAPADISAAPATVNFAFP